MKSRVLLLSFFFVWALQVCKAQDLSVLDTVAHYPLINTAHEIQDRKDTMEIINSPYAGNDGVYCNGLYIFGFNPDGSLVQTPPLSELYDSTFAVQVEFMIDNTPGILTPVFVCGTQWRYFGMGISGQGNVVYFFNDTDYKISGADITPGVWHTITGIYSNPTSTGTFWLDGIQMATRTEALVRDENAKNVSNTNYGFGLTFLGYMRNFMVLSTNEEISGAATTPDLLEGKLFPNPAHDFLQVNNIDYTAWTIYTPDGKKCLEGKTGPDQPINISALPNGTYIFAVRHGKEPPHRQFRFLKN